MPTVVLSRELAARYCAGVDRLSVDALDASTVRGLIRALEMRYPGLGEALRSGMAVAIDGAIYQDAMLEPLPADAEVAFLPAIEGG